MITIMIFKIKTTIYFNHRENKAIIDNCFIENFITLHHVLYFHHNDMYQPFDELLF